MQLPRASGWRFAAEDAMDVDDDPGGGFAGGSSGHAPPRTVFGCTQYVRGAWRDPLTALGSSYSSTNTGTSESLSLVPCVVPVHHFGYPVELQFLNFPEKSSVPSALRVLCPFPSPLCPPTVNLLGFYPSYY